MVCRDCGYIFKSTEVDSSEDKILFCPKCSAIIDSKTADVFEEEPLKREYDNGVAGILRSIAYITWISGILAIILFFLIAKGITAIVVIEVINIGFVVFVSGMMFYAFGEVIQLLTEIRNDQRKRK